ncbi:MAG: DUF7948 domain-containing protein, partial [Planctomycetota bacterium]
MRSAANFSFLLVISFLSFAVAPGLAHDEADKVQTNSYLRGLPTLFIENKGQFDDEVAFHVQGSDKTIYFTSKAIHFAFFKKQREETRPWNVKLEFLDADPVSPEGRDRQKAVYSYFRGRPEEWHGGCATYSRLVYENLWPGIDLVYSGAKNKLKYEFKVKPGADPARIRLAYRGAEKVAVEEGGSLRVTTPAGGFEDGRPYAYQMIEGKKRTVPMAYAPAKDMGNDAFFYGFEVGDYDPTKPLILDPVLLVYCGYIGGDEYEEARGVALDGAGNAYVSGFTKSKQGTFPVTVGPDLTYNGGVYGGDAFVAKVAADGT